MTTNPSTNGRGVALTLHGLTKCYGEREVLRQAELRIEPGQFLAIVGRSGCGKSTRLRLVAGLEHASAGRIAVNELPQAGLSPDTRIMFQDARLLLLDEPLSALDALTRIKMHRLIEGLWLSSGFTALLVTHDVQEAVALANRVILIEDGRIALDETIALARPPAHGDAAFAASEKRILDRVLQKPAPEPAADTHWPSVPAQGLH